MSKIIKIQEAIALIQDHNNIVISMAAAEPQLFLSHLSLLNKQVQIMNCLPLVDVYQSQVIPKSVGFDSLFYSSQMRKLASIHQGLSYVPSHLHQAGINRMNQFPPDIFIGSAASDPNESKISLSLSNVYEMEAFKRSKIKIIELNPNMPFVYGDHVIHREEIDYIIESSYLPTQITYDTKDQRDETIGILIANHIEDGSTLQFGIGAIPNAVAKALIHKKDLGIHTEMLSDGLIELIKLGVANGHKKTLYPNKHICSFILGTQSLYDYVHRNSDIQLLDANHVNDPYVIGQNHKQISINTTIEIDLTGQCNSETLNQQHFSGTGGQTDTAVGAQRSKNGKSFIALHSTALLKTKDGQQKVISKIVPRFTNGDSVSLSRNDVDYVVTEYGVVKLKGLTNKERIIKLISIAHPDFKEYLLSEAKKIYKL